MDDDVYKCLDCGLVFGAEEDCDECPDCSSTNITRDVSEEEFDSYLKAINNEFVVPKKIRVWIEMPSTDYIVDVPEWVKTKEDLDQFADDVANKDCSSGYEAIR